MNEKNNDKMKIIAFLEMFLLVSMSFSLAFIFSEYVSVVEAQGGKAEVPLPNPQPNMPAGEAATKAAAGKGGGTGFFDSIGQIYGGTFGGSTVGPIVGAAAWGLTVFGLAYLVGSLFGLNDKQKMSVALSAGLGAATWSGLSFAANANWFGSSSAAIGTAAPFIGIGVGVGIFLATYKKYKTTLVRFECYPWEPPLGGADCEKCNKDVSKPCSEYKCKSLGQGCGLVNKGTNEELCVWVSKNDVNAPTISPWNDALYPKDLKYIRDSDISPPNHGFKIVAPRGKGCLQAFTQLKFGILTNEPAQCKIDYEPRKNYDEMQYLFGETNSFLYNHTQSLKVPSPFSENGSAAIPEIHNKGTYTLYVRCIDANGNGKDSAFTAFRFCVDDGPDTLQPEIVGFSIESGSPVRYDADKVPIEVYTNEPADCRWSRRDQAYDSMENRMTCGKESYQVNADLNYVCFGELTGIVNKQNNEFYFRCKDNPNKAEKDRNVMTTSKKLVLRGTEALTIDKVGPNGTISGATSIVVVNLTVQTGHGAEDGKSICYIDTKADGDFSIAMDSDYVVRHVLPLDFAQGSYEYFFRCVDRGGNAAYSNTSFNVVVDTTPPLIARAFRDGEKLKIITNEAAKCAYSLTDCRYNFAEATNTVFLYEDVSKKTVHYVDWNPDVTYYIKCADMNGRLPADPNKCSLVVRGSEL